MDLTQENSRTELGRDDLRFEITWPGVPLPKPGPVRGHVSGLATQENTEKKDSILLLAK